MGEEVVGMGIARTCEKHGRYCPDGECPYCEPEAVTAATIYLRDWEPVLPKVRMIPPPQIIPCKCGEFMFDRSRVQNHHFEQASGARVHTPARCWNLNDPRDRPITAADCRQMTLPPGDVGHTEFLTSEEQRLVKAYREAVAAGRPDLRWYIPRWRG